MFAEEYTFRQLKNNRRKIRKRRKNRHILWTRVGILFSIILSGSFFLWVIFYCYINPIIQNGKLPFSNKPNNSPFSCTDSGRMERTLLLTRFKEDSWRKLVESGNENEIKKVLQAGLDDLYADLIGSENEKIKISIENLDEKVAGQYCASENMIKMNRNYVMTAKSYEVYRTLAHEVFHIAQYEYVQGYLSLDKKYRKMNSLYFFQDAQNYFDEYKDYTNPEEDFTGYYTQRLEIRAREYAEAKEKEFFLEIDRNY